MFGMCTVYTCNNANHQYNYVGVTYFVDITAFEAPNECCNLSDVRSYRMVGGSILKVATVIKLRWL